MLVLGIRYLTGYAVATDVSDRERAEWPPHPARVFMALAAAMFETGENRKEQATLEWLERQGAPAMKVSDAEHRTVVTCYVPVNDSGDPVKGKKSLTRMQSVAIGRDRQPRTIPRVRPLDDTVFLIWSDARPEAEQRLALDQLCDKVTRIGHSSSLVQMWVEEGTTEPDLIPADFGKHRVRIAGEGTLDYLTSAYNLGAIQAYGELHDRIAAAKGATKKQLKDELVKHFGSEPNGTASWGVRSSGDRRIGRDHALGRRANADACRRASNNVRVLWA